jgi:hypothetical protein
VGVYINDPRDDRPPPQIYDLGVRSGQGKHVLITTNGLKKLAAYGYGLFDSIVIANGYNFTSMQDDVSFTSVPKCHRHLLISAW